MSEPVIVTEALRRTFGKKNDVVEAVAGVDLRVEAGTIFGFLGPNGAGKTTTLRILATLLPPTSGVARVAGLDVATQAPDVRRRIGYVAQTGGTDPRMTGRGELVMQGRLFGLSGRTPTRGPPSSSTRSSSRTPPTGRSRPTRAGCAAGSTSRSAWSTARSLLFLDEPTTGLDPQARARMWDEVRRLRDTGTTVFLTTHYLEEADALCDRLAIIDHGRIVAEGTADGAQARRSPATSSRSASTARASSSRACSRQQPFVREAGVVDGLVRLYVDRRRGEPPAVLRLLDGAGPRAAGALAPPAVLDDVFLRQTGRSLRDAA